MNEPDLPSTKYPARKAGDEIIEISSIPDAELQCIDCIRQVLDIFFPESALRERERVLQYCQNRYADHAFPRRVFLPGTPRPPQGSL